jgi:4-amino-4-deoxy-L-arabinose transferase-like glycosyltransferase
VDGARLWQHTGWMQLALLFLLAVGARLLYILDRAPDMPIASVDAWGYHRLALNLEQGNGFSLNREDPFLPDSIRTPLYPAFLWLVRRTLGPSPRAAAVVQALLEGSTMLLVWWLGSQLAGRRAGRIAALLYALNPTQIRYTGELLTETLLSLLLAASLCALVRYVHERGKPQETRHHSLLWLTLSATILGLAVLCKPNVQYLPPLWLFALAAGRSRDRRRFLSEAGLLLGIPLALALPWIARNQVVLGRPFLSTAFEGNVSRISAPATLAAVQDEYAIPWSAQWDALFGEVVEKTAERYVWDKPWDTLTAQELDQHNHQVFLVARQILIRHPWAWLTSHTQGLVRYLEPKTFLVCYAQFTGRHWPPDVLDDALIHVARAIARGKWKQAGQVISSERWTRLDPLQRMVWWGTLAGQVIGLALVVRGLWRLRNQRTVAIALALTITYVMWLPGPIAYERFRVPVTSLILSLVGASVSRLPPSKVGGD